MAGGLAAALPIAAQAQLIYPLEPVRDAFPGLQSYLRMPAERRSHFKLFFILDLNGRRAEDIRADIVMPGGARRALRFGPLGGILNPPTLREFDAGAMLYPQVDLQREGFALARWMQPAAAPDRRLDARALTQAIEQGNAWMRRRGLVGRLMPPLTKVQLTGARSGAAIDATGRSTPLPHYKDRGEPFFNPSQSPGAVRLELERRPSLLLLQLSNMGGERAT